MFWLLTSRTSLACKINKKVLKHFESTSHMHTLIVCLCNNKKRWPTNLDRITTLQPPRFGSFQACTISQLWAVPATKSRPSGKGMEHLYLKGLTLEGNEGNRGLRPTSVETENSTLCLAGYLGLEGYKFTRLYRKCTHNIMFPSYHLYTLRLLPHLSLKGVKSASLKQCGHRSFILCVVYYSRCW